MCLFKPPSLTWSLQEFYMFINKTFRTAQYILVKNVTTLLISQVIILPTYKMKTYLKQTKICYV